MAAYAVNSRRKFSYMYINVEERNFDLQECLHVDISIRPSETWGHRDPPEFMAPIMTTTDVLVLKVYRRKLPM